MHDKKRHKLDQYFTPGWAVRELLKHVNLEGTRILEPCAGEGGIWKPLRARLKKIQLVTNDIDPTMDTELNFDATTAEFWDIPLSVDWVITNPPFSAGFDILWRARQRAKKGVAFLMRLSFLEPTKKHPRGAWLHQNPPDLLVVLPRYSFTGDGKTDSVACAWMVWYNTTKGTINTGIRVAPPPLMKTAILTTPV